MFELQPILENELLKAIPLKSVEFEKLYSVASDPLVWEQHPSKTRYQREVFEIFFKGALESGGAFLVLDRNSDEVIGSSRFYDFDPDKKSISIGYTFLARKCWGKNYNQSLKRIMINHAFKFADKIVFHVGAVNIRSQKAMEKLGAIKVGEEEKSYYGEQNNLNFVYEIIRRDWV